MSPHPPHSGRQMGHVRTGQLKKYGVGQRRTGRWAMFVPASYKNMAPGAAAVGRAAGCSAGGGGIGRASVLPQVLSSSPSRRVANSALRYAHSAEKACPASHPLTRAMPLTSDLEESSLDGIRSSLVVEKMRERVSQLPTGDGGSPKRKLEALQHEKPMVAGAFKRPSLSIPKSHATIRLRSRGIPQVREYNGSLTTLLWHINTPASHRQTPC
jgi:hypothetical protein